ncbi:hypothetical protein EZS27_016954 [termite gut metagenome]|uniref:Uncharacterized protein n=1 Tax=termite gut metagenome TaxID=433724 RepID=A0A5J4RM71_9ZZZZ
MATVTELKKAYNEFCKEKLNSTVNDFVKDITDLLLEGIPQCKLSVSKELVINEEQMEFAKIIKERVIFKLEDMELDVKEDSPDVITITADF